METIPIPWGTALEMLTPLQALSLPAKGSFPSLAAWGVAVTLLVFPLWVGKTHSMSVLCALERLYFGKTMQPTAGLGQDHASGSSWSLEMTQGHEQSWEQ